MARRAVGLLLAVVLAAVVLLHQPAAVKGRDEAARASWPGAIRCQVCEIYEAHVAKQQQEQGLSLANKPHATYFMGITEKVCRPKKPDDTDWMHLLRIVEKCNRFELDVQDGGRCNDDAECETIWRAWHEAMMENNIHSTDDFQFLLKDKPSFDELMEFLCEDISGACAKDRSPAQEDISTAPSTAEVVKEDWNEGCKRVMKNVDQGMNNLAGKVTKKMLSEGKNLLSKGWQRITKKLSKSKSEP